MRALVLQRLGDAARDPRTLVLREVVEPVAAEAEAVIRVALAPINPSDFLFMAGEFPGSARAVPGQIAGLGGAGYVETPAPGGPGVGALVSFTAVGSWADRVAVPAAALVSLPSDMPLELAAQFSNVITAWELVDKCGVQPGGWLAMTAGYSTVAILALQFAVRRGIHVLSIVRGMRSDPDLVALGATAVLIGDGERLEEAVLTATSGAGLNGIIDCVAGPLAGDLIRLCAPFSKMQLYGSLDARDLNLTGKDILYRGLHIISYSYPFSFRHPTEIEDIELIRRIGAEVSNGRLYAPIGGVHPIADYQDAIGVTAAPTTTGKRFLRMMH